MKDWNQVLAIKECTGVEIGWKLTIVKPIKLVQGVQSITYNATAVNS